MSAKSIASWLFKRVIFAIASLLLFLAILVSAGREFIGASSHYKNQIEAELEKVLSLEVSTSAVDARWSGLNPNVILSDLTLAERNNSVPLLEVMKLQVEIDVLQSLFNQKIIFGDVHIYAPIVSLRQHENGDWQVNNGPVIYSLDSKPTGEVSFDPAVFNSFGDVAVHYASVSVTNAKNISYQVKDLSFNTAISSSSFRAEGDASLDRGGIIPLQFDVDLDGDWRNPKDIEFDIYLGLSGVDVFDFLPSQHVAGINIDRFTFGTQLWVKGDEGNISDATVLLNIPKARFQTLRSHDAHEIELLTTFLHWEFDEGEWDLAIDKTAFYFDGKPFELEPLAIGYRAELDYPWKVFASQVSVAKIADLAPVFLSDEDVVLLNSLNPKAILSNVNLEVKDGGDVAFNLKANVENLSIKPVDDIPGVENVSGYLEVNQTTGYFDFAGKDVIFNYDSLFRSGWIFDVGSGRLKWDIGEEAYELSGESLNLSGNFGDFRGDFYAHVPYDERAGDLDLYLGVRNAKAEHTPAFIPADVMDADLVAWIDSAIKKGTVKEGAYIYQGSTALSATAPEFSNMLFFDVVQGDIEYQKKWPAVTDVQGVVVVDRFIQVYSESSRLRESSLKGLFVEYHDNNDVIEVIGGLDGTLTDIEYLMKETPLKNELPDDIQAFDVEGLISGDLALSIAESGKNISIQSDFSVNDANLRLPELDLVLADINGDFQLDSNQGVSASGATANFHGTPLVIDVHANRNLDSVPDSLIKFSGTMAASKLPRFWDTPWLAYLQGETEIAGEIYLQGQGNKQANNYLSLASSLQGVAIDLPYPIGKKAKTNRPLTIKMNLDGDKKASLSYGENIQLVTGLDGNTLKNIHVNLGAGKAKSEVEDGISISGSLDHFNVDDWRKVVEKELGRRGQGSGQGNKEDISFDFFSSANIQFDQLTVFEQEFKQTQLAVNRSSNSWVFDVKNDVLSGEVTLEDQSGLPSKLDLDYLNLPEVESGASKPGAYKSELSEINPSEIPWLSLKVNKLALGKDVYGSWDLDIKPYKEGVRATVNAAEIKGLRINKDSWLDWKKVQGKSVTELYVDAAADNVGDVLSQWDYARAIESETGAIQFRANWDGSPDSYDRLQHVGELGISLKEGRFLEVERSARVLRLVGVFNVTKIARRMRLDFSDLYEKGFQFDRIDGVLSVNNGIANWKEDLKVASPSSSFSFSGDIDFNKETLDQEMLVTLPVSENLPWYAVLAAQPAVAVGLWVVNELFEDQLNKFSSARYTVTGSFDDPKVEFDKLFDKMVK